MWRLIFGMIWLLAAAWPAPGAATPIDLSKDSASRWVPFTLTDAGQIRVSARINGRRAVAIIDTGVSISLVSRDFARKAGMRIAATSQADAIGGGITIGWAGARSLSLGGLTRRAARMAVADLPQSATGGDIPVDALIGADLIACCALDLDYDAGRMRFLPSGTTPFDGQRAPLSRAKDSEVFVTALRLGGTRVAPVLVDTGDGGAVTITPAIWRAGSDGRSPATSAIAFGLGGPIRVGLTIVPALSLGSLQARNVEVRVEDESGFSRQTGMAGRIGSGLLRRYRLLIDAKAGRMVLRPGRQADAMPVRSTSGLLTGVDRDRLRVLHVMANSPAAKQGWQTDDMICSVDGRTIAANSAGSVDTGWAAGTPGTKVRLGMCDGTERVLTLRIFY
ncbi:MAG: hypothetical protein CMN72_00655 [Sphingomonas sp.]|nr:hypothetical protein [Sphingomonas sp.]